MPKKEIQLPENSASFCDLKKTRMMKRKIKHKMILNTFFKNYNFEVRETYNKYDFKPFIDIKHGT
jgi:hypothetical protein